MMPVSVSVAVFANWQELLIRAVAYDFADFISCVMAARLMGTRSVLADDHCAESACSNSILGQVCKQHKGLEKRLR